MILLWLGRLIMGQPRHCWTKQIGRVRAMMWQNRLRTMAKVATKTHLPSLLRLPCKKCAQLSMPMRQVPLQHIITTMINASRNQHHNYPKKSAIPPFGQHTEMSKQPHRQFNKPVTPRNPLPMAVPFRRGSFFIMNSHLLLLPPLVQTLFV